MNIYSPTAWLLKFLESYERFRPTAYPATASERARGIWTIGYGHTKGVKEGDTCTMAQAEQWLKEDIAEAIRLVLELVKVPCTVNELDALVSLVFNAGPAPLQMTLGHLLNAGNKAAAVLEFKKWDKQAGKELDGLEKRRVAEANHFLAAA